MHSDFSSWPRDQEQSFVVYEQRNSESSKAAFTMGGVVATIWLVLLVGIYFGVAPDNKDVTKGMNMDNLTKKSKSEPKAATPDPAPAPKAEAPAAAPAAPAAEAPAAPADKK